MTDIISKVEKKAEELKEYVSEMEVEAILTRNRSREKTDLQKFVDLYKGFGIELSVEKCEPSNPEVEGGFSIELRQGSHPKFNGYSCFLSTVIFDKDGKFIEQGFWE